MMSICLEKCIQNVRFRNTEFWYGCWAELLLECQLLSPIALTEASIASKAQTQTLKRNYLKEEKAVSPNHHAPVFALAGVAKMPSLVLTSLY